MRGQHPDLSGSGRALVPRRWWPKHAAAGAVGVVAGSALCTLWPSGPYNAAEAAVPQRSAEHGSEHRQLLYDDSVRFVRGSIHVTPCASSAEPDHDAQTLIELVGPRLPAKTVMLEDRHLGDMLAPIAEDHWKSVLRYLPVAVGALIHERWRVCVALGGNWITHSTCIHILPKSPVPVSRGMPQPLLSESETRMRFAEELIDLIRKLWELPPEACSRRIYGLILVGPSRVGKTFAVKQVARLLASKLVCFRVRRHEHRLASIQARLAALRAEICWLLNHATTLGTRARIIVLFDDLDCLCSGAGLESSRLAESSTDPLASMIGHWFDAMQQRLASSSHAVICVATVGDLERIDATLRRADRFEWLIHAAAPTTAERMALLKTLGATNPSWLAAQTAGYLAADCVRLAKHAFSFREAGSVTAASFRIYRIEHAGQRYALAENHPGGQSAECQGFAMLGGHDDIKQALFRALAWPLRYRETCARLGVRPARAVLLYGPPGCGKTRLVRAAVDTLQQQGIPFTFLSLSSADLYSAFLGESERTLREVFAIARSLCPALIFLDEIDTLVGARGCTTSAGASDIANRLLGTLLTEIDSLNDTDAHVVVVGATNRIDRVDPALLRPGRFDVQLEVPLPGLADRRAISTLYLAKAADGLLRARAGDASLVPLSSADLDAFVESTAGCSGAEIEQICFDKVLHELRLTD
ncbi:hypothetical protein F1559_000203 [Cyanidiococcus yangmingshanensis]|uniref:AAA+ ATPase domain-containing protein n=1 Tax=Cyanidiococcus yangmingshanensis TaxID=2690220 RepID=A0A7J7IH54_9RHOD|nr:hypothetical protein F1559_000203 [Cyanidiococcus yangmingshanensis]